MKNTSIQNYALNLLPLKNWYGHPLAIGIVAGPLRLIHTLNYCGDFKMPYSHHVIAWIKEYLICLGEHRVVDLILPGAPRQLVLFN